MIKNGSILMKFVNHLNSIILLIIFILKQTHNRMSSKISTHNNKTERVVRLASKTTIHLIIIHVRVSLMTILYSIIMFKEVLNYSILLINAWEQNLFLKIVWQFVYNFATKLITIVEGIIGSFFHE